VLHNNKGKILVGIGIIFLGGIYKTSLFS